ncbi:hypothetical protein U1E44_13195 [Arenibacter sp. GZD96]|uniref:hypothetical protein n=1 Tax=Aurantibrevibacter litoralis TaxID=3106030 RepID=UPI002AFFC2C7|nr:hypothetical protein [Arenibacter sp. GZD-96]MEA1787049.1 hypothetical protein [Arenibacter sp. GZD-96]
MKTFSVCCLVVSGLFLSAFRNSSACEYAGSNLSFVKTQTLKALETEDINMSRFFAYKALNAIEKSKEQLNSCGCKYASTLIGIGLEDLKIATKVQSLSATKLVLQRVVENVEGSIEAIYEHDLHEEHYSSDSLVLNTKDSSEPALLPSKTKGITSKALQQKIDLSLEKFENSLDEVITTADCKKAHEFAKRIERNCEQQLLKPELSEGKKYYYLKTRKITAAALTKLGECPN